MPLFKREEEKEEEEEDDDTDEDVESFAVRVSPNLLVILRGSGGVLRISNRRKRTDVLDMKSFMTASVQQVMKLADQWDSQ